MPQVLASAPRHSRHRGNKDKHLKSPRKSLAGNLRVRLSQNKEIRHDTGTHLGDLRSEVTATKILVPMPQRMPGWLCVEHIRHALPSAPSNWLGIHPATFVDGC